MLCRARGEFSNLIIPGFFTHAAIYTPQGQEICDEVLTEAVGEGVQHKDIITFLTQHDYVAILEPNFLGDRKEEIMRYAAEIAIEQIGKPYDFEMEWCDHDIKAFYCSELVWYAYDQAFARYGIQNPLIPKESLGEDAYKPSDFFESKFITTLWDSRVKSISLVV